MKEFILEYYKQNNLPIDKMLIGAIRNNINNEYDMFNDYEWFIYDNEFNVAKSTTDPGKYYTDHPMNSEGAFHMNLGFQKNIWRLMKHKGKYLALCNDWKCNKQKGWRDKNKNFHNDDKIPVYNWVGANWHYSNSKELIKYSSAGCYVTPDIKFFNKSIECAIASEQESFSEMTFDISEIPVNLIVEIDRLIRT